MKKIVFFIFLSFIFYLSASESRFPISDENKELYSKVYDEAQYVLQKNHYKMIKSDFFVDPYYQMKLKLFFH